MMDLIVSGVITVVVGGLFFWWASRGLCKSVKELSNLITTEMKPLLKQTNLILGALQEAGVIELTQGEDGKWSGRVMHSIGHAEIKVGVGGLTTFTPADQHDE